MDKNYVYKWFFALLFLLIFYGLYKVLKPFFIPLLWSVVLAVVLFPVYKKLNSLLNNRRNISSSLMILITTIVIILPFVFLLSTVAIESYDLYNSLKSGENIQKIKTELSSLLNNNVIESLLPQHVISEIQERFDIEDINIVSLLSETALNTSRSIVNVAQKIATNVTLYIINFGITLFALFFFFRDGERFYSYLVNSVPMETKDKEDIAGIFSKTINVTVTGNLAVAAVQGLLLTLIFIILGINYPVLAGFTGFILSIIPLVGAAFVWLPVSIILIAGGSMVKGIILLLYGVFIISISDNLLRPIVIGKQVKLHTLFLFLAIIGGIDYFGFSGIIIGPLLLALSISFLEIYRKKILGLNNNAL